LGLLVVLVLCVSLLGWSPLALLFALLALVLPTPIGKTQSLRELEARGAQAYTTALVAPEDDFGFQRRLEGQALAWQRQTDPPAWPWLEGLLALAVCSLLLVFPQGAFAPNPDASRSVVAAGAPSSSDQNDQGNDPANAAPPVLDAPSRNAAPSGDDARPGQAASGGTPGETQVGDLKDGGGNAKDDPAAVSREFMEALERGAVRDSSSRQNQDAQRPNQPQVQDNDASAAQQGSASGGDQSGAGDNAQQGQNGSRNQNGQRGNQGQGSSPGQNPQTAPGQPGTQPGGDSGGNSQNPNQSAQSGSSGANNPNGQRAPSRSPDGRGQPGADDGSSDGSSGQRGNQNNANRGEATRGTRGSSVPKVAERPQPSQNGRLEYLPGTVRGRDARSGALQLPGDPRQPLTGTPGTPAYRRAAEGAVLDPKLPPEYQELLRNYYR
jgi:hypothetical protein